MRKNTLAFVISSMLMAVSAQAQPAEPTNQASYDADQSNSSNAAAMAQQRWSAADTDRNGTLSKAEMQISMPTMAANFSKMDSNGDGQLSQDEMHGARHSDKGQWNKDFKAADTDRDGSLTLTEAQSGMPMMSSHFAAIDTDKDGKVTTQELASHQRFDAWLVGCVDGRGHQHALFDHEDNDETATEEAKPDAGSSR